MDVKTKTIANFNQGQFKSSFFFLNRNKLKFNGILFIEIGQFV